MIFSMNTQDLLEGLTAYDVEDGYITESIIPGKLSLFKEKGVWQEYPEKYKEYYPEIREAFTQYGLTAVELKDYLKKYFQLDISLAGLSKLLLKLGLRRNKYHKRKRTKGKR